MWKEALFELGETRLRPDDSASKRRFSLVGMVLIADGLAFLTNPREELRLWSRPSAPRWYRRVQHALDEHTALCRLLGAAELLLGLSVLARVGKRV